MFIKSMTAYGRGECHLNGRHFVAEIKSLNNRYRDVIIKAAPRLQGVEEKIRSQVTSKIRRGRIEISLQVENTERESSYLLELNEPLARSYVKIFEELAEKFGLKKELSPETLCQYKDIITYRPEEPDLETVLPGCREALERGLESLESMKAREGETIASDLLARIELLEKYAFQIQDRVPRTIEDHRAKLAERIQTLVEEVPVEETRIAQEVAFFAERVDITEEIVRMKSHIHQFREYLKIDDALGRRLDFLVQEMNREVNTTSAKASDAEISKVVVEMKAELEKIREQVQNIE